MPVAVYTQTWREAIPLESTKTDLTKTRLGEIVLEDGRSRIVNDQEVVTLRFNKNLCTPSVQNGKAIALDVLIEIRVDLKYNPSLDAVIGGQKSHFEKILLRSGANFYINHRNGFLILTELSGETNIETVKTVFQIPKTKDFNECIRAQMDTIVGEAFDLSKFKSEPSGETVFFPIEYLEYPDLGYWNAKALYDFAKRVSESKNSKGYVFVYAGEVSRKSEAAYWIRLMKNRLKRARITKIDSITFVDGGFRRNAAAMFMILPAKMAPPRPTPTITPDKVKIVRGQAT